MHIYQIFENQLAEKDEYSLEIPMLRKSGDVFISHLSLSLLRNPEGDPVGTAGFALLDHVAGYDRLIVLDAEQAVYHVIYCEDVQYTTIQSFTIRGGNADGDQFIRLVPEADAITAMHQHEKGHSDEHASCFQTNLPCFTAPPPDHCNTYGKN